MLNYKRPVKVRNFGINRLTLIKYMFGFKNIKKFIIGSDENKENNIKSRLHHKIDTTFNFASNKINDAITECGVIREKLKDLCETNYNLGIKHLENGHISEAVFRFKIVKKFWPHYHDAYYQLAYALILADKVDQAQSVIAQLIEKYPSYQDRASELLASIDKIKEQQQEQIEDIES